MKSSNKQVNFTVWWDDFNKSDKLQMFKCKKNTYQQTDAQWRLTEPRCSRLIHIWPQTSVEMVLCSGAAQWQQNEKGQRSHVLHLPPGNIQNIKRNNQHVRYKKQHHDCCVHRHTHTHTQMSTTWMHKSSYASRGLAPFVGWHVSSPLGTLQKSRISTDERLWAPSDNPRPHLVCAPPLLPNGENSQLALHHISPPSTCRPGYLRSFISEPIKMLWLSSVSQSNLCMQEVSLLGPDNQSRWRSLDLLYEPLVRTETKKKEVGKRSRWKQIMSSLSGFFTSFLLTSLPVSCLFFLNNPLDPKVCRVWKKNQRNGRKTTFFNVCFRHLLRNSHCVPTGVCSIVVKEKTSQW